MVTHFLYFLYFLIHYSIFLFNRALSGTDFAADFHVYGLSWNSNTISFTVDGEEIGAITPPAGGFWELGGFENDPGGANPWAGGALVAPFDKPVSRADNNELNKFKLTSVSFEELNQKKKKNIRYLSLYIFSIFF